MAIDRADNPGGEPRPPRWESTPPAVPAATVPSAQALGDLAGAGTLRATCKCRDDDPAGWRNSLSDARGPADRQWWRRSAPSPARPQPAPRVESVSIQARFPVPGAPPRDEPSAG